MMIFRKMFCVASNPRTPKRIAIGENLAHLMRNPEGRRRFTQEGLAQATGLTVHQIKHYVYGNADIPEDAAKKIAAELGVNWRDLYKPSAPSTVQPASSQAAAKPTAGTEMKRLPVVGSASAGAGSTNVDVDVDFIWVPAILHGDDHLGKNVDGDSMMPALHENDVAVFKSIDRIRPNRTHLIKCRDHFYIKLLEFAEDRWQMVSRNPAYPPEPLADEAEVLGFLIGIYRIEDGETIIRLKPKEGLDVRVMR